MTLQNTTMPSLPKVKIPKWQRSNIASPLRESDLYAKRIVVAIGGFLVFGLLWAWLSPLDEVTSGKGKVVPSSQEQVIQSLEGGILRELNVRPDNLVEAGMVLARLDPIGAAASVQEIHAQILVKAATVARLAAEISDSETIDFPVDLEDEQALRLQEAALFEARRDAQQRSAELIQQNDALLSEELKTMESLAKRGAVSQNTVLQLKRQIIENSMQAEDLHRDYYIKGREEMSRLKGEVQALEAELARRKDQLNRLTHVSPVRGIVKELAVTTIGGVVAPNGNLMTIVPIEDDLLVETKILPENIAFIRPGLPAVIKITAYDSAIYGTLEGEVISVSPDSMQDEFDRSLQYYRVFVRATRDALVTPQGVNFAITPGMLATVDIHTGSKTVLQYLMKPLNRAGEAMRER